MTSAAATRRRGGPPRGCDVEEFDDWLRQFTERTDPGLAWLGVVFALVAVAQLITPASDRAGQALNWVSWLIWAVFLLDFTAKLWLAPRKTRFLRTHWISLLGLLVPTLRIFSFLRLARLGRALPAVRALTTSTRAARSGTRLFRSRLSYLAGLTSIGTLTLAELAYLAESGPHGTLPTFWSALIWAGATVIGQSRPSTPSPGGANSSSSSAWDWASSPSPPSPARSAAICCAHPTPHPDAAAGLARVEVRVRAEPPTTASG